MNLLVTLNEHYLVPLVVLLYSLLNSHPLTVFTVYLLHSSLGQEDFDWILEKLNTQRCQLVGIEVDKSLFADAPVCFHFTQEMYYRIFAAQFLPPSVERVLYLDPDMVVINSLESLYQTAFDTNLLVAAASPNRAMQAVHRLRLGIEGEQVYFNSGMMLMNTALLRKEQDLHRAFRLIEEKRDVLKLPDQDLLNSLYGDRTIIVDPMRYNLDARYYPLYRSLSLGRVDLNWVNQHTAIIHYCGKRKPFKKGYSGPLGEYYTQIAEKLGLTPIDRELSADELDPDDPLGESWIDSKLIERWRHPRG